jgi:hypothetical protein
VPRSGGDRHRRPQLVVELRDAPSDLSEHGGDQQPDDPGEEQRSADRGGNPHDHAGLIGSGAAEVESANETAAFSRTLPAVEPVSPELALVDPDLRRADIARLAAHSFAVAPAEIRPIGTRAAPAGPHRSWAFRAAQGVMLIGLMAAGVLVANVAARDRSARPILLTNSSSSAASQVAAPTSQSLDARSAIEQELLQLVVRSPSTRLPRALVDPQTGLAVNNLQAVCHASVRGTYLCLVRPSLHRPGEGLYVRYGPNGFSWYPYRAGSS